MLVCAVLQQVVHIVATRFRTLTVLTKLGEVYELYEVLITSLT